MVNEYTKKSLEGVWIGDCIGNLGQLYYVHDILAALENGVAKFGSQLNQFSKQFQYSMQDVNSTLSKQRQEQLGKTKEGSCGNGSAMRIAPLGAFFAGTKNLNELGELARLSAEVTHCHPEGIAGAVAIAAASYYVTTLAQCQTPLDDSNLLSTVYFFIPDGQVREGIKRAIDMPLNTPIGKAREILGNGTHVTCQDTVPLCCWLAHKALLAYPAENMYQRSIVETSMAFGDVDTNCAIVGGIVGIVSPPPEKWVKFCQEMEGVL